MTGESSDTLQPMDGTHGKLHIHPPVGELQVPPDWASEHVPVLATRWHLSQAMRAAADEEGEQWALVFGGCWVWVCR